MVQDKDKVYLQHIMDAIDAVGEYYWYEKQNNPRVP